MNGMYILTEPISRERLQEIAKEGFGDFVKAVVDVEKEVVIIGGELHADGDTKLLDQGSNQSALWGINLYPDRTGEDVIELDSMINIRPTQGNRSRGVENPEIQMKIRNIVQKFIP